MHKVFPTAHQLLAIKFAQNQLNLLLMQIFEICFMFQARRLPDVNSPAKNAELVYMEDSPDPCRSTRITNRVCNWRNETSSQGDCGLLCCGRGSKVFFFIWNCNSC